jgi:hypothetical protein
LPISLTIAFKDELCKIVEIPLEISSKPGIEFLDEAAMFLHDELTYLWEQLQLETTGKLSFTDEVNATLMHTANKVDKLVSLFEGNVQRLPEYSGQPKC